MQLSRVKDMGRLVRPQPDYFFFNVSFLFLKTFIVIEWPDYLMFAVQLTSTVNFAESARSSQQFC